MSYVTDLNYPIDDRLIKRLDKFAEMVMRPKNIQDVLFTLHGKTGAGKTNGSLICAYYLRGKTDNREIHLFFKTGEAAEFAKKTREKIIIIDEPSLDSLSKDQMSRVNKDFFRLLNTMREKRHIVIVNITRFWRFPFDMVVDRALCMINVFNDGKRAGRFQYIRQKKLEYLWEDYHRKKEKNFSKYKSFNGNFSERMQNKHDDGGFWFDKMGIIINGKPNCTLQDYKDARDNSVANIGIETKLTKREEKFKGLVTDLRIKTIAKLKKEGWSNSDIAEMWGINKGMIPEWTRIAVKEGLLPENWALKVGKSPNLFITNDKEQEKSTQPIAIED